MDVFTLTPALSRWEREVASRRLVHLRTALREDATSRFPLHEPANGRAGCPHPAVGYLEATEPRRAEDSDALPAKTRPTGFRGRNRESCSLSQRERVGGEEESVGSAKTTELTQKLSSCSARE